MSYLGPGTASLANVPGTNSSSTVLFPAVSHSGGRMVYNDSTQPLFLAFGTVAAAATCTTVVGTAATYTFPAPVYCGQVTGIWVSPAGTARTTWW